MNSVIRTGHQIFETRHKRKDGTTFDVEVSVTCMSKTPLTLVCFCRDISERKNAENQLSHSHDLLRYIIEHNQSAVAVHDANLNYLYVSQPYLDSYQVKEKNIIGKHHYEVFPDLLQKWRDVHQRALEGEVVKDDNDPYLRSDGTIDWTRWECRPWYTTDGTVGGIIVYTEMNKSERREIHGIMTGGK